MHDVLIYQIGYGQWGPLGFEKFLELKKAISHVEIAGLCDIKEDRRNAAKTAAKKSGLNLKVFNYTFDMYKDALEKQREGYTILIYDAGPSELHAPHMIKSIECGFFHIAEKPPYTTKDEEEKIKALTDKHNGRWTSDLIEDESPVVKTAIEYAKINNLAIKSIKAYRYNSMALKKIAHGGHRLGITGGDLLDKMLHEAYISRFLEGYRGFALKKAQYDYLLINSLKETEIIDIHGKIFKDKAGMAATAQSSEEGIFRTENSDIPFSLGSGWLGVPGHTKKYVSRLEKATGSKITYSHDLEINKTGFTDEELRIFIIEGLSGKRKISLLGDMKHKKLFEKSDKSWRELSLMKFEGDQLYRVLKNAIYTAEGKEGFSITESEINFIMDIILKAREIALKKKINTKNEIEKAKKYMLSRIH